MPALCAMPSEAMDLAGRDSATEPPTEVPTEVATEVVDSMDAAWWLIVPFFTCVLWNLRLKPLVSTQIVLNAGIGSQWRRH